MYMPSTLPCMQRIPDKLYDHTFKYRYARQGGLEWQQNRTSASVAGDGNGKLVLLPCVLLRNKSKYEVFDQIGIRELAAYTIWVTAMLGTAVGGWGWGGGGGGGGGWACDGSAANKERGTHEGVWVLGAAFAAPNWPWRVRGMEHSGLAARDLAGGRGGGRGVVVLRPGALIWTAAGLRWVLALSAPTVVRDVGGRQAASYRALRAPSRPSAAVVMWESYLGRSLVLRCAVLCCAVLCCVGAAESAAVSAAVSAAASAALLCCSALLLCSAALLLALPQLAG
ncbi:hypothetical protein BDZ91DRAFT_763979 [Kalaharituber pfeilii]|nr:hypothetical protein BDZ91DRAFT_763979 [Kalaharituber pfeilii]